MSEIGKLESRVRDFINSTRRQSILLKKSADWNTLCSALDIVGDTQLAIDSYPQFHKTKDDGAIYLLIYGILQGLLLQQNAAKNIGRVLGFKVKLPKQLNDIRVIRNGAAGHPMSQKENGLSRSCFISRGTILPKSFQLMTIFAHNNDYKIESISIPKLIDIQRKYLSEVLEKVVVELERQEMEHRKKHSGKKLLDSFPHTIDYHFSKIYESTRSSDSLPLGEINLKVISKALENFKSELEIRGEWNVYDAIDYHYDLLEYPLNRLVEYFDGENIINAKDAYIYTSFLSGQIESLKEIAKELDEKYESNSLANRHEKGLKKGQISL